MVNVMPFRAVVVNSETVLKTSVLPDCATKGDRASYDKAVWVNLVERGEVVVAEGEMDRFEMGNVISGPKLAAFCCENSCVNELKMLTIAWLCALRTWAIFAGKGGRTTIEGEVLVIDSSDSID